MLCCEMMNRSSQGDWEVEWLRLRLHPTNWLSEWVVVDSGCPHSFCPIEVRLRPKRTKRIDSFSSCPFVKHSSSWWSSNTSLMVTQDRIDWSWSVVFVFFFAHTFPTTSCVLYFLARTDRENFVAVVWRGRVGKGNLSVAGWEGKNNQFYLLLIPNKTTPFNVHHVIINLLLFLLLHPQCWCLFSQSMANK